MAEGARSLSDVDVRVPQRVRRAWLVLIAAAVVSLLLLAAFTSGGYWIYRHATTARPATLTVEVGYGVLVRTPTDTDWRLVTGSTTVREGDRISTPLGVTATIVMFDGTTIDIEQESTVHIVHMRDSRFLERTRLFVIEPEVGTIYVAQTGLGNARFSEVRVQGAGWQVESNQEVPGAPENRYVIEVLGGAPSALPVRVGVFSGKGIVTTDVAESHLVSNQQAVVEPSGALSDVDEIARGLLVNGDFDEGLAAWVPFAANASGLNDAPDLADSIRIVADSLHGDSASVVEFTADGASEPLHVGIRQRIGRSLRVVNSLEVGFDVRITRQSSVLTEPNSDAYPLVVTVEYIDTDGETQRWKHAWFIDAAPDANIPNAIATKVDVDSWQRIVFDLRNLTPTPQQVISVELAASGTTFQTRIANVEISIGQALP